MKRSQIMPLVLADIEARVAKGTKEYGEPLTSHNGRDALWDAYEEALDLAMYLRQEIAERGGGSAVEEQSSRQSLSVFLVVAVLTGLQILLMWFGVI